MDFNVSKCLLFFQTAHQAVPPWVSRILRFHAAMRMTPVQNRRLLLPYAWRPCPTAAGPKGSIPPGRAATNL